MVALDSFYPMTGVTEQLAQWQKFAPNYVGDGVIAGTLSGFSVAQHTAPNMSVDVATGQCFIQGVFGESGSVKTLTITAADATNPRIDRVVLRCDTVAQDLELLVLTGVAAVSPSAPALIRSATQTDYSLSQVLVGTTVTSIVTANCTDERLYAGPRGIPQGPTLASATTLQPYGPSALTEGHLWCFVTGTTSIANIATGNLPPRAGAILILRFLSAGCTVAVGGNISIPRTYISGTITAELTLLWTGAVWTELARSGEQAPAHQYYGNPTGTVAAATFAAIVAADLPAYADVTLGSLSQGSGVAYTQTKARAAQHGKLWQGYGQLAITGTGTAANTVLLTMPSGVVFNGGSGTPLGTWRLDAASQFVGVITLNGASNPSVVNFAVPTSPATFYGTVPTTALANTNTLWFTITGEII